MSQTHVEVLTPPGSSAVAVLAVRGPNAWPVLQRLFRTAGGRTLAVPPDGFVFGRIGDRAADEVVLATIGSESFEVHCHGGMQVVSWLLGILRTNDIFPRDPANRKEAIDLLPFTRTVRTAGILLDQVNGAYDRAAEAIRLGGSAGEEARLLLRRNARVGRHLIGPWKLAIAGAPNAGKSSLLNALAGFDRSVVSPIPGTTRDAVSISLAFDGWPIDLIDTAGLHESEELIEVEGMKRARSAVATSDVVLWVIDSSVSHDSFNAIAKSLAIAHDRLLLVFNKIDLVFDAMEDVPTAIRVSAVTGIGLNELVARIVAALVPEAPAPGDPVPFTPELCDRWS